MRNYFLKSARLGFDLWNDNDLPLAVRLWSDPAVMRLTGGQLSDAQAGERLAREMANQNRFGIQYWPIFLLQTGEHVGTAGLRPRDPHDNIREIGFHLRPTFWGQGLAREAGQTVIAHGFLTLQLAGIHGGHHPKNDASRRILEALGFRYTHDEFYPPTQLLEPCYLLSRSEFRRARPDDPG
jgi:ribosomal-protein-alanine N-acetyltransferase